MLSISLIVNFVLIITLICVIYHSYFKCKHKWSVLKAFNKKEKWVRTREGFEIPNSEYTRTHYTAELQCKTCGKTKLISDYDSMINGVDLALIDLFLKERWCYD